MSPEHTQQLYDAFPQLYRGKDKPPQLSSMLYGFCCGDGWFALIWKLSGDIERVATQEGRLPDTEDWPEARQVKDKLGRLRFHVKNTSPAIRQLIGEASDQSEHTCEICGSPGAQLIGLSTLCQLHSGSTGNK